MVLLLVSLAVFVACYVGLSLVVYIIHKLTKNTDRTYRLGILIFSFLAALYTYSSSIGRR